MTLVSYFLFWLIFITAATTAAISNNFRRFPSLFSCFNRRLLFGNWFIFLQQKQKIVFFELCSCDLVWVRKLREICDSWYFVGILMVSERNTSLTARTSTKNCRSSLTVVTVMFCHIKQKIIFNLQNINTNITTSNSQTDNVFFSFNYLAFKVFPLNSEGERVWKAKVFKRHNIITPNWISRVLRGRGGAVQTKSSNIVNSVLRYMWDSYDFSQWLMS